MSGLDGILATAYLIPDSVFGTVVTIKSPAVAETEPIESADIRPTVLSW